MAQTPAMTARIDDRTTNSLPRRVPFPLSGRVLFAAVGLFVCTGGPSTFATLHVFHLVPSAIIWTNLYPFLAVALAGVVLCASRLRQLPSREIPWPVWPIGAFVAWALLSATWSSTPNTTPVAAILGVGIAAFGCWIGLSLAVHEQVLSVLMATATATILSLPVIAFRPTYGREPLVGSGGGEWMGIYGNRNSLAAVSALGVIAAAGFVAVLPSLRRVVIGGALATLQVVVLWGTHGDTSRISIVLCAIAAGGIPLLWVLRRLRVPGMAVSAVGITAAGLGWVVLFDNMKSIAAKLGMDPTLSQRTIIWRYVRSFIRVHPFHGYGYWGFWDNAALTYDTYHAIGKAYASAHNSVLEVLLMLGVVGLIFYLAIGFAGIVGILRWVWARPAAGSWWWGIVLVYLISQNMTESFVLWHSYNWVLFIAASITPLVQGAGVGLSWSRVDQIQES